MTLNKLDSLLFFDGVAIFFIVTYHELYTFPENPLFFLVPYLVFLGLSLFTVSAGYKLGLNHIQDLNNKKFLGEYFLKRFIRLYKPYIGYSFLILVPILVITYISVNFLNLNYAGLTFFENMFNNMDILFFIKFLSGDNTIAVQLWYLVALIGITSVCFTLLYLQKIERFFFLLIPFFLLSLFIKINVIKFEFILVDNIFLYLPFFMFGIYWSYSQTYQKGRLFQQALPYFPLLFLITAALIVIFQNLGDITILQYLCGYLFPFFLTAIFEGVKRFDLLFGFLMFCGSYSFQIYLFHSPLILQVISRFTLDILKMNFFLMPVVVIPIVAVYACVVVYKITQKIHVNRLFE